MEDSGNYLNILSHGSLSYKILSMKNAIMLSCFTLSFLISQCFYRISFIITTRNKKNCSNYSFGLSQRSFTLLTERKRGLRNQTLVAFMPTCSVTLCGVHHATMLTPGFELTLMSPCSLFGINWLPPRRPSTPVSERTLPECKFSLPLL